MNTLISTLTRRISLTALAMACLMGLSSTPADAAPDGTKRRGKAPSWTQSTHVVGFVANSAGDTIRVKLRNADELLIVTRKQGSRRLRGIRETDLNVLVARIDEALQTQDTGRTITLRRADGSPDTSVQIVRIPSTRPGNERDRNVTISIRRPDKGGIDVVVNEEGETTSRRDTTRSERKKRARRHRDLTDFSLLLGLNNYLSNENGQIGQPVGLERLQPIGSRFVALSVNRLVPFTRESRFGVNVGLEFAWNNFRLSETAEFTRMNAPALDPPFRTTIATLDPNLTSQPGFRFRKHKLVVASLRVPVSMHIPLGRSASMDLGGWAGLRLDDYTRTVYRVEGQTRRIRERQQLYVNDFQAALRARVNFDGIGFFADYHLTPLFAQGRGPELVPYSIGIVL